ncbi:MAG: CCA tRNA nucleotidyltransferase [Planctomycetota bacterium]
MADDALHNPTNTQPAPRDTAVRVVQTLNDAGHTAYFAGGCVRDRLMGNAPKDYDVATSARPEDVRQLFRNVHNVGEAFGVMLVRENGHIIEVASFRTDGIYCDGRRPENITFSSAEEDAARRDFTINGLFEDPLTDQVIDYVGGRDDLEARTIRAIGNAHMRFREDHLRMLRAVRFAARFSFSLDADTADAIRAGRLSLDGVSRERIGQELRMMMLDSNRAVAAWELQYLGLDAVVLHEENLTVAPTRLGRLPDDIEYATALVAWILDRHATDFEDEVDLVRRLDIQSIVAQWTRALMLSNAERDAVRLLLQTYRAVLDDWSTLGVAARKRLAAIPAFQDTLVILQTVERQQFVDRRREVVELARTGLNPDPLVTGDDLVDVGMTPGPDFGRILEAVYDAQLEGSIHDRDGAIALARIIAAT